MKEEKMNANVNGRVLSQEANNEYFNAFLNLGKDKIKFIWDNASEVLRRLNPFNDEDYERWKVVQSIFDKCVEAYYAQDCGNYWIVTSARHTGDGKIKTYKVNKPSFILEMVNMTSHTIAGEFDKYLHFADDDVCKVNLSEAIERHCGFSHNDIAEAVFVYDDFVDIIRNKMSCEGYVYKGLEITPLFDELMVFEKA